ncbi:ABC-2 type transporter [Cynara cardunculus var. scolymus]|uniref:ABC-2 type transporter n=1 Tax=Cynara cardunculus var. scolymus TaxID=59895 RepID=A0A103YKP5_CYNCS|nr:ABC-2 type transporter [Cynara cardunculus var. scolymus]
MEASAYLEKQNPQEVEITISHAPPYHKPVNPTSSSSGEVDGVSLTWKDLWLTVPDGKGKTRPVLEGAYVTQDETLITTLTVRESVYYSALLQLPDSMSKAEKKERAEMTIREMGLQDSMDTRIGGWGAKGLSGGQKRRVSICIEILTRPKLLFLDEPTSGLDSAASYYVMSRIARLDEHQGRTIIASIHQPCSEVFDLFHNLCLLSSGRTVYFGDTSSAKEVSKPKKQSSVLLYSFFAFNGFPCPSFQNPSDHFLRSINKDFDEDIEQGSCGRKSSEEVIKTLIDSYRSSTTYQDVNNTVTEIYKKGLEVNDKKKNDHASFSTQCLVLTRRSLVNMHRDLGYYWLRLGIYIAICLGLGTIFFDLGSSYSSIQARSSMLMFVATFLTFMAIGGFPSFVEDMKVFESERLNGHYTTGAFVIANTLSSMPYLVLVSLIPGVLAYYLAGLREGFDHFAYFASTLFSCMLLVESLMMIVASLVPNYLMGIIAGAGIQGLMILGGGFFRLPNDLPHPFWKYPLYYVAFHKYAYQGLFKNEFQGEEFMYYEGGVRKVVDGEYILREKWQVEMGYSKWIDLVIILGMVVISRALFWVIIKIVEKVKPGFKGLIFAVPKKHSKQVLVNPLATPSH